MVKWILKLSSSSILRICFVFFISSNILLFYFLLRSEKTASKVDEQQQSKVIAPYFKILHKHFKFDKNEWRLSNNSKISPIEHDLNCSFLHNVGDFKFVAAGWTKATFQARLNNTSIVAVKSVNTNGHDVSKCMNDNKSSLLGCYRAAASKLLQEIVIFKSVRHSNIIKVLGYCIPEHPDFHNPRNTVAIFQEYGEAVDVINLLQSSWEDRLRICLGLTRLLQYLSTSPFGPIALNDFRRQQFVLIGGELKLIDIDDAGLEEPRCSLDRQCCIENTTACVLCSHRVCRGHNERLNIFRSGKHFINHILPYGAPTVFNASVYKILQFHKPETLKSATSIFQEMENLSNAFINGLYRQKSKEISVGFRMFQNRDLPMQFDYKCGLMGHGCTMSVFDLEEAKEICSFDSACKAFVLTDVTTWTGRKIVHFKNGVGAFLDNNATSLFVKL